MVDRVAEEKRIPGEDKLPTIDELPPAGYPEAKAKDLKELSEATRISVEEILRLEKMSEDEASGKP